MRPVASVAQGLLMAMALCLGTATSASAADDGAFEAEADASASDDTVSTWVVADSGGAEVVSYSSGAGGSTWVCTYYAIVAAAETSDVSTIDWSTPVWPPPTELFSALICRVDDLIVHSEIVVFDPGDPLAGFGGAERARDTALANLVLPKPAIELSPPRDADHLVGLPSWLSIANGWDPGTESAALGAVTSTVMATPTTVTWDPGDGGDPVVCDGPGGDWAPGEDPACGHTYTRSGTFTLTATIEWDISWQASTGVGGPLTPLATTSTWPVTVRQAQAVLGS